MNKTIINNPCDLSREDLVDEYQHLSRLYTDVKNSVDKLNQQAYDMRNRLSVVTNNESYLTQELETINQNHDVEMAELREKHRLEVDQMRKLFQETIANLESEHLNRTKESVEVREVVTVASAINESAIEREQALLVELESEKSKLMDLLDEANVKLMEASRKLSLAEVCENVIQFMYLTLNISINYYHCFEIFRKKLLISKSVAIALKIIWRLKELRWTKEIRRSICFRSNWLCSMQNWQLLKIQRQIHVR